MIRELNSDEVHRASRAILQLRPHLKSAESLLARIKEQRSQGYRLIGSFDEGKDDAAAVAGFRVISTLAWGRVLYVDDLVTDQDVRGRGHADSLFAWLVEEALRLSCDQLHLDSGTGPDREAAHRFYFKHGLRISSYHFSRKLKANL